MNRDVIAPATNSPTAPISSATTSDEDPSRYETSGKIPPTENAMNELIAAVQGDGWSSGSTPSSCVMCTLTASSGSACTSRATASAVERVRPMCSYMSASSASSSSGCRSISSRSTRTSCATASFCVSTDANSPSAIENAPATRPRG